jgi:hypothetical protein
MTRSAEKRSLDVKNDLTAVWIAILVLALGVASDRESQFRQEAQRLDLKVMTLELQGNSSIIDRMGVLRNQKRATAERWESTALSLSLAAAIAAVTILVTGWMWAALGLVSLAIAARAGWAAALAMGVL